MIPELCTPLSEVLVSPRCCGTMRRCSHLDRVPGLLSRGEQIRRYGLGLEHPPNDSQVNRNLTSHHQRRCSHLSSLAPGGRRTAMGTDTMNYGQFGDRVSWPDAARTL